MAGHVAVANGRSNSQLRISAGGNAAWLTTHLKRAAVLDSLCALLAGTMAAGVRFASHGYVPPVYVVFTCVLPILWTGSLAVAGGYEARFVGAGSDEFRRVLNASVSLLAGAAIVSYVAKLDISRAYVTLALPSATALDLVARYRLRKHLHKQRAKGAATYRVVAVGHAPAVADLIATLRRDTYHGLSVVAACLVGGSRPAEIAGVPTFGGPSTVRVAVNQADADVVAVLACPEMNGIRLRELAWELEDLGTGLFVAPALLDIAGPRTVIRAVAGLPLLYMDHPELDGGKQLIKGLFDRLAAALALGALMPLFAVIALAIRIEDGGPVMFWQTRVGKDGRAFRLCKFRSMVNDAEQQKTRLAMLNEGSGMLFKMRRDPRITRMGTILRRWSLDELPQFYNVLVGDMSLVGPRPAIPEEAARYGNHMRRRLAVKPGITGLWQVSGRSDLSWEESLRLDLRYVENWSFALDLQILWKTWSAVIRGRGAY